MYTVIGTVNSRALRVLWALEELEQPYELTVAPPRSEVARAHNPSGKIPALLVDGTILTDSTAIVTYLADRYGALTQPAGTLARAQQDALTHKILDEMDAVLWTAARHSFILPEEHRVPEVKESLKWEFARTCTEIADRLGDGPFLCGEAMTVPDILLTHCIGWAMSAKFPIHEDRLTAYARRMRDRPAYQRAVSA